MVGEMSGMVPFVFRRFRRRAHFWLRTTPAKRGFVETRRLCGAAHRSVAGTCHRQLYRTAPPHSRGAHALKRRVTCAMDYSSDDEATRRRTRSSTARPMPCPRDTAPTIWGAREPPRETYAGVATGRHRPRPPRGRADDRGAAGPAPDPARGKRPTLSARTPSNRPPRTVSPPHRIRGPRAPKSRRRHAGRVRGAAAAPRHRRRGTAAPRRETAAGGRTNRGDRAQDLRRRPRGRPARRARGRLRRGGVRLQPRGGAARGRARGARGPGAATKLSRCISPGAFKMRVA